MRWIALAVYAASIVAANWMTGNVGLFALPDGTHLIPVGFGLLAPSGVYAAGFTFIARDLVQRSAGPRWALAAIAAGTALTVLIEPRLALGPGLAFLCSELADFGVYTRIQERHLALAIFASGVVGSAVDSLVFHLLAEVPPGVALSGVLLGKLSVQLFAFPLAAWLRGRTPPGPYSPGAGL